MIKGKASYRSVLYTAFRRYLNENFMIKRGLIIFVKNCLLYDAIRDFSVWLSRDSNLADINRFQNHTGKKVNFLKETKYDFTTDGLHKEKLHF